MKTSRRFALKRVCAAFASFVLMSACGGDDDSSSPSPTNAASEGKVGSTDLVIQDSPNLRFESNTLVGDGKAAAKQPAGEVSSQRNFALDFTLEDGGSVTLAAYATQALEKGVLVKFTRSANALKATLTANGKDIDLSPVFTNVNASRRIGVLVDVHNNETPAHVIAWTSDIENPSADNPVYESERDEQSRGAVPGNGQGTFWGLVLSKAKVTKADAGDRKFVEEAL